MATLREREDFALLMQETMDELKEQREQNAELLEQNRKLLERISDLVAVDGPLDGTARRTRDRREKIAVTLQTRVCECLAYIIY